MGKVSSVLVSWVVDGCCIERQGAGYKVQVWQVILFDIVRFFPDSILIFLRESD
jgi:hypothetical protein